MSVPVKMAHLYIVLPEVGMEGEGLRSSQGIAVPVVWADTQNTPRIRTLKDIPERPIWCYSLCPGEGRHLCWDIKECFPWSSSRAGPWEGMWFIQKKKKERKKALMCWFHRICVSLHSDSPWLDMERRRSVLGCLCCDCLWAVAKRQNIFLSYVSDTHSSGVRVEPHQVGPHLHQQAVSLLWHLWPQQRPTLMRKTLWLDAERASSGGQSLDLSHTVYLFSLYLA